MAAVLGPTASGKTTLGIGLAEALDGEIISCDSMQIYEGLPIGTAQPSPAELARVPHHLVGFLAVEDAFSVSDYVSLAEREIGALVRRGKLPVVVGGTGLYARSLLRGFHFEENARDEELRRRLFLRAEQEGAKALFRELEERDPVAAGQIHPNNLKRVVRALEYCILTGEPFSRQALRSREAQAPYRSLLLCLRFRNRQILYDRIDARVDQMLEQGLVDEATAFFHRCGESQVVPTAAQAIGYKELFPYFRGEQSLEEAVCSIKQESRRYAKRQITWFSREKDAVFLDVDGYPSADALLEDCIERVREARGRKEGDA